MSGVTNSGKKLDIISNDLGTLEDIIVDSVDTTNTIGNVTLGWAAIRPGETPQQVVSYLPDQDLQHLAVGETYIDNFSYKISDRTGNTDTADVQVIIEGENDIHTLKFVSNDSYIHGAGAVIGSLEITDIDSSDTHTVDINDDRFEVLSDGTIKMKDGILVDEDTLLEFTVTDNNGHEVIAQRYFDVTKGILNLYAVDDNVNISQDFNDPGTIASYIDVVENDIHLTEQKVKIQSIDTNNTLGNAQIYQNDTIFPVVQLGILYETNNIFDYLAEGETVTDTVQYTATTYNDTIIIGGTPPLPQYTDTATVTFTIQGINDAPTNITLDNINISENIRGVVVGNLTTTDIDTSDTHTYTVDDDRFKIDNGVLSLKTDSYIDYENEQTIDLNITSTDNNGLSVSKQFTLQVFDEEDNNSIIGTSSQDSLSGGFGEDIIAGLSGNDFISGDEGDDILFGQLGNDIIIGGEDNDTIYGGYGNDYLFGGEGDDILVGGLGKDFLNGGIGSDKFVFSNIVESLQSNPDTINDFEDGVDLIDLSGLADEGITSFSDLVITKNLFNTVISDNNSSFEIRLSGNHNLDQSDFVF